MNHRIARKIIKNNHTPPDENGTFRTPTYSRHQLDKALARVKRHLNNALNRR
jgi:hypothetical protein